MINSLQKIQPFWTNPVVIRDMRVRMRGSRAFWNQGAYLGLLSVIAVMGYYSSTKLEYGATLDPITIQRNLQQFYYWIFEALALLIALIAPALTAASIISEKKLQTLDLLVTTPMTSMQMLSGKLISSIAFVILLLVLSIPASALCIILGGATIVDVMQSYALLAIDSVVLSAIGLAYSCSAKQHLQAISQTYTSVILLFILTATLGTSSMSMVFRIIGLGSHTAVPAIAALFELNPFFSAAFPSFDISIFGLAIPVWVGTAVVAVIMVRLMLTGAALRLGMYGANLAASLRRQILGVTFFGPFIVGQALTQMGVVHSSASGEFALIVLSSVVFGIGLFFLPTLLVPAINEDGPPGEVVFGSYDFKQAFTTKHSGALPYFHIWLFCLILGCLAGMICPTGPSITLSGGASGSSSTLDIASRHLPFAIVSIFFYLSGLGFLLWSLGRRAAWIANSSELARRLTSMLFTFIVLLPCAVMLIESQASHFDYDAFTQSVARFFWLMFPYTTISADSAHIDLNPFWTYGSASYILGAIIYPFWKSVVPGGSVLTKTLKKMSAKAA